MYLLLLHQFRYFCLELIHEYYSTHELFYGSCLDQIHEKQLLNDYAKGCVEPAYAYTSRANLFQRSIVCVYCSPSKLCDVCMYRRTSCAALLLTVHENQHFVFKIKCILQQKNIFFIYQSGSNLTNSSAQKPVGACVGLHKLLCWRIIGALPNKNYEGIIGRFHVLVCACTSLTQLTFALQFSSMQGKYTVYGRGST